ncbi:general stress acyl- n-acyltransferase [Bacillus safensis]|uniref:GNAT family N-acetyltransferase n=1 Tax=Bacillus safensis TaxID=561879 RepID=UPI00227E0451|nr:general stress acyl- n-acyltransferase [Bacillus safensis]MCY7564732.1 general stress acyl- n-acyltransferase [Bacillus safensis]MCY7633889.1 general stress acyl- n-acyltransferase [Bacillus safensis]MCY7648540.1 general stress acyl- n-acyltransferase [Bacillus safensis]MEC3670113.1 general stress acyl- n-acyltransferase [Bacillus safensis]MEC3682513.1 general stress acyl- n-acyltransferase [Bacillus safensis]
MYYQLRIATEQDVPAINAFLEKGQAKGGVTLAERTAFVVMEDADSQLAGCLGLEQLNEQEGLLRSLIISDKLGQGHIVSLFQSVQTLGEKMGVDTFYVVANHSSSHDFLALMGFTPLKEIPESIWRSAHAKETLGKEQAVVLQKKKQLITK